MRYKIDITDVVQASFDRLDEVRNALDYDGNDMVYDEKRYIEVACKLLPVTLARMDRSLPRTSKPFNKATDMSINPVMGIKQLVTEDYRTDHVITPWDELVSEEITTGLCDGIAEVISVVFRSTALIVRNHKVYFEIKANTTLSAFLEIEVRQRES